MRAEPVEVWDRAVDFGASGRYADALESCLRLGEHGGRWLSVSLSTRASHLRQVGAIVAARMLDEQALAAALDADTRADALIGLAADAVAAGDAVSAIAWHREAADALHGWRTRTRWHWVGAEMCLLSGDLDAAVAHAGAALSACEERSPRHRAKSEIVLAAATGHVTGFPDLSEELQRAGWASLEWPLALVAADHSTHLAEKEVALMRERGVAATHLIEGHLPAGLVETWLGHPGVRRLRAAVPSAGAR